MTLSDTPNPTLCLDDLLAEMLRSNLAATRDALAKAGDTLDVEAVHQARVALRRLRAALGLVRRIAPESAARRWSEDMKRLADLLGRVRDWDVFLTHTLPATAHVRPDVAGFEGLAVAARSCRQNWETVVGAALGAPATSDILQDVSDWCAQRGWRDGLDAKGLARLDRPAARFAAAVLDRLRRKALTRGQGFRHLTPEERHRTRIALKRLRYMADELASVLDNAQRHRRYGRKLSRLQDALGAAQDRARTADLLGTLDADPAAKGTEAARGAILDHEIAEARGSEAQLAHIWAKFRARKPPWR
jgi:CHAD domain-containing protein